jgi:enamine deaminase RidA (YjgF/YER057c/UK114 family)
MGRDDDVAEHAKRPPHVLCDKSLQRGRHLYDAAWTEFFGDDLPTRATVGVADLGGSALIEVVVTALKG